MRRRLIQVTLPFLLCSIPVLAAGAVAAAIEVPAREFYLQHITWMDVLILTIGTVLFFLQMLLTELRPANANTCNMGDNGNGDARAAAMDGPAGRGPSGQSGAASISTLSSAASASVGGAA
ncbi:MAG: hypothetical protein HYS12_26735, partial [Planctomycetes bacterium]|nr:hypothetical protein [Planctomycetota bacterium]